MQGLGQTLTVVVALLGRHIDGLDGGASSEGSWLNFIDAGTESNSIGVTISEAILT